jgi:hypothetical protein
MTLRPELPVHFDGGFRLQPPVSGNHFLHIPSVLDLHSNRARDMQSEVRSGAVLWANTARDCSNKAHHNTDAATHCTSLRSHKLAVYILTQTVLFGMK